MSDVLDVSTLLSTGALDATEGQSNATPVAESALEIDEGNLLVRDFSAQPAGQTHSAWLEHAREAVQALFASLFTLPVTPSSLGPIASLPPPTYPVPRGKALPKPKSDSKWEKFRKEKGIVKRKKGRMVWDENAKEYKPRWGKDRVGSSTEPWAIEDKPHKLEAAGASDPFELKNKEKALKKAKHKKQEIMNKRRDIVPLTGTQLLRRGRTYREKYEVERALNIAQKSTASLGRFDKRLTNLKEPQIKRKPQLAGGGDLKAEKEVTKKVVERVLKRQHEALEIDKMARQQLATERATKKEKRPYKKARKE